MQSASAIIAEDEPLLREGLKSALAGIWPELTMLAVAGDGLQAMRALNAQLPDVLFLDIEMPGMSGIEIAQAVSGKCHVVFVTAYDEYAVAAFDAGAVDYLLKPVTPARLATAVLRLKERLASAPVNLDRLLERLAARGAAPRRYLRWINASQGQDVRLITVEEICYFQADNKYTIVVTKNGQPLIRKPLRELLDELDPDIFWQVHRSTIVNVNAITAVCRDGKGNLRLRLKGQQETLAVSEQYAYRFRQS